MASFTGDLGERWSYEPDSRLGDISGFGEVFRGADERGNAVAVKKVELKVNSEAFRRRRDREIEIDQILKSVSAEHVVHLLDIGRVDSDLFLVMPLAKRSLADAIKSGDLDQLARAKALRDIAQGLAELAEVPVLHRDLKPANVLEFNGIWKLADFGISRNLLEETDTYTFRGSGTIPYMAPELWEGKPATVKTDLYALGILAFELFAGSRPFSAANETQWRLQHLQGQPPPLPQQVPSGIQRVIMRLLMKDPTARPQDARAVVEKIDAAVKRLTPQQEQLREAALAAEQRYSAQDTEIAAQTARRRLLGEQISQAVADLNDICEEALDLAKEAVPEIQLRARSLDWKFHWERVELYIEVWSHSTPDEHVNPDDPLLIAGIIASAPNNVKPYGNIVCEVRDGRLLWKLLRFEASGLSREYTYGPRDQPHGFQWSTFVDQRPYMLRRMMHVWHGTEMQLDAEAIVQLLHEAISKH